MARQHSPNLPAVMDVIPHRPPSLWLDGVTSCIPGESATGFWTPRPKAYAGHFEEVHLLMAVKQVEAAAQLGAYALMVEDPGKILATFKGIREFSFSAPVFPDETLDISVSDLEKEGREFSGRGIVTVNGEETASGVIEGTIMPMRVGMRALAMARDARNS